MSDDEKPNEEDKESQTDVSHHVQTFSLEKIVSRPQSSGITINFYPPNYTLRSDKPVQTENSDSTPWLKPSIPGNTKNRKLASESREIRSFDYSQSKHKKINTPPHETRQNRFMNTKKFSESKARTITDLERKKLEAELKATEEIAKIQQAVIEKRLALELASLQDGNDFHQKNQSQAQSAPHEELRALEDLTRKQNLLQYSLSQDLVPAPDNPPRSHPPRPPQPSRPPLVEAPKLASPRAESNFINQNSSDLSPIRQLIEKKINIDMGKTRTSDLNSSPPPSSHRERFRGSAYSDTRYGKQYPNMPPYPPPDQPGCSPYATKQMKTRSLWKSAVIKIKKKIKHSPTPPPPWE